MTTEPARPLASTPTPIEPAHSHPSAPAGENFGVLARMRGDTDAGPWQQLTQSLLKTLERALADITTLEVRTFVAHDMSAAAAAAPSQLAAQAELRAFTRIGLAGDLDNCIPARGDGIDDALWSLHRDMVQQAQAHRAELLRTLLGASANLLKLDD